MNIPRKISLHNDTLGILCFLITFWGVLAHSIIHFDNTIINWTVTFSLIYLCFRYAFSHYLIVSKNYLSCTIFLLWAAYGAIAGIVFIDNYWIAKQWLLGISCVALPCLAYVFSSPEKTILILKTWNKWVFPTFLFLFVWIIEKDSFHFSFGPVFCLYGLFWFWLPHKWKWWTACLILLMILGDIHARAQVIKGLLCIVFSVIIYNDKFIPGFIIRTAPWAIYLLAITLLYLGLSGTYNIFDHKEKKSFFNEIVFSEGNFSGDEKIIGEQALTDTRTFIYIEVFESAIYNDYVLLGRTLARGNDSEAFGKNSLTGYNERYTNELCHLNIFTWLGAVGVILYAAIYLISTWLAAYRSNNIYISYLGIYIAFNWAFGWIENQNRFDGMNIGFWMIIGMCLSPKFRAMSRQEFELWFRSIFSETIIYPYIAYKLIKIKIIANALKQKR